MKVFQISILTWMFSILFVVWMMGRACGGIKLSQTYDPKKHLIISISNELATMRLQYISLFSKPKKPPDGHYQRAISELITNFRIKNKEIDIEPVNYQVISGLEKIESAFQSKQRNEMTEAFTEIQEYLHSSAVGSSIHFGMVPVRREERE